MDNCDYKRKLSAEVLSGSPEQNPNLLSNNQFLGPRKHVTGFVVLANVGLTVLLHDQAGNLSGSAVAV